MIYSFLSFLSSLQRRPRNVPAAGFGGGTDIPRESHLLEESGRGALGVSVEEILERRELGNGLP